MGHYVAWGDDFPLLIECRLACEKEDAASCGKDAVAEAYRTC